VLPSRGALPQSLLEAGTLLLLSGLLLGTFAPSALLGQTVVERTPNLSGGWVGDPGVIHVHLVHRFWRSGGDPDAKVVNSPTMVVGVPLPGRVVAGVGYASNSLVASDRFNEWEALVRWAPPIPGAEGVRPSATMAYNATAGSLDLEGAVAWDLPLLPPLLTGDPSPAGARRLRLLGSIQRLGTAFGDPGSALTLAGGGVARLTPGLSLAADVGRTSLPDDGAHRVWSAGIQARLPTTPHSISLQVGNTRTGTLQGSSRAGRTVWGFEFTVPVTPARYLPLRGRGLPSGGPPTDPSVDVEIGMTGDLRFAPDTVRIRAGETVRWTNTTDLVHTVTLLGSDRGESVDSGSLRPGDTFRHTFATPGTFGYTCVPHDGAGMRGVVVVVPP
jgi:plastocyanin